MTKQNEGTAVADVAPSNIFSAIASAQAEIGGVVGRDSVNSYLNVTFASLSAITKLAIPAFAKQGLAVLVENWRSESGDLVVRTILAMAENAKTHIDVQVPIPPRKDGTISPQEVGIALSYGRRYGLLALAGLAEGNDHGVERPQRPQRQAPQQRGQQQRPAPAQRQQPQQATQKQKAAPKQAQQAPTQEQLLEKALHHIKECSLERLDGAEQWASAQLQGTHLETAKAALSKRRKELESASTTSA